MELWDEVVAQAPTATSEQLGEFANELARVPDVERRLTWIVELDEHPWWVRGEETDAQPWLGLARCIETEVEAITELSADSALVRDGFEAITRVELTMVPDPAQLRRALWRLPNLVELDLTRAGGAGSDLEGLLNSLPPLRHLEFKFQALPVEGMRALRRSEAAEELRHLDLSGGYVRRADFAHLAALSLRSLVLSGCGITAKDLKTFAGSQLADCLWYLDLRGCPQLTDWSWSVNFPRLRYCVIDAEQATRLGKEGVDFGVQVAPAARHARDLLVLPREIAAEIRAPPYHRAPPWSTNPDCWWSDPPIHVDHHHPKRCIAASVEHLLDHLRDGSEGWAVVERWKVLPSSHNGPVERVFEWLPGLREVDLDDCAGFEFVVLLAALPAIDRLSIRHRRFGAREASALARSSAARSLRSLDASAVNWADGGFSQLGDLMLERLDLRNCRLSTGELEPLIASPLAGRLVRLDLRGNDFPTSLARIGIRDLVADES